MKQSILTLAALALLATSCNNESAMHSPDFDETTPVAQQVTQNFKNGSSVTISTQKKTRAKVAAVTSQASDFTLTDEERQQLFDKHIELFPEKANNLTHDDYYKTLDAFSYDYLFRSTGEPFNVLPLYTCYHNYTGDRLLLFWLDEDGNFNYDNTICVWEETATTEAELAKKRSKYNMIDGATQVCLPEGTIFGFYFWNTSENARHFSYNSFNALYQRETIKSGATLESLGNVHSMITYRQLGYTVISMDATFPRLTSSYDGDINDIVFLMTPPQPLYTPGEPDNDDRLEIFVDPEDIDKDFYCEADDFALSNNLERYPEYYNIGASETRRIHVQKDERITVTIDNLNELDYDENLNEWTYETWVWLSALPGKTGYLIGTEESADWTTYSNSKYKIGVSAYQGIASQNDTGYIKVSVHIRKR